MNIEPKPDRRQRPAQGRTPGSAAHDEKISVLSAILTGRRSRSLACVLVALVIALTAVVTVAATIVSSHLADDGEGGEVREVLAINRSSTAGKTPEEDKSDDAPADSDTAKDTDEKSDGTTDDRSEDADEDGEEEDRIEDKAGAKDADAEVKDGSDDSSDAAQGDSGEKTDDADAGKDTATKAPGVHTVTVTFYDKEDFVSDTTAATLGELLNYSGVTLNEAQLATLDLSTKIDSDMTFMADRITYDTITEDEALPFDTQYRDTTEIAEGTESVAQEGAYGVLTTAYDVKYVNGVEVYREQKGSWVSTEAIDRVILRGVAPAPTYTEPSTDTGAGDDAYSGAGTSMTANGLPAATVYEDGYVTGADGVSRHYYAYLDVQATVYDAGGYTAYGLPADENVMGVGRYEGTLTPIIPFGTVCYVVSSRGDCGQRISADFGNMFGNKIDLCMYSSNPLYYGFGWQSARVYFLG